MPTIGIDLGTTNSCVATIRNGVVEIISNDDGKRVTPSVVAFTSTQGLVGDAAKIQLTSKNTVNVVYQVKRLMGRTFYDKIVQTDKKSWTFNVVSDDEEDKPKIEVTYRDKKEKFYPEQISALVLKSLKEAAQIYLAEEVKDAVITVPAYFNDAQRKATADAGKIAGLNVLSLINEPTAAAIAYGLHNESDNTRIVLIFDLGGGTFDVTIVQIKDREFDVIATGGDNHLGGEDFDNVMVQHFAKEFNKKFSVDIFGNKRAMSRLRNACEQAKRNLSSATETSVDVDALFDGLDFSAKFTRAKFEDMNYDYFAKTIETVEEVLEDAHIDKDEIDEVVLVGGSTRIPKIKEMLEELFETTEIRRTINPDEAVAYGAAVRAESLGGGGDNGIEELRLSDVAPLSLGLELRGRDMMTIVKRNSKIPTRQFGSVTTVADNQTELRFAIYEGERAATRDNNHLGTFYISGIPPAPRGIPSFEVCFDVDSNGVLKVRAFQETTGLEKEITIENKRGRLTEKQIRRMLAEAEMFKKADEEYKKQSALRNSLENFAYTVKQSVRDPKYKKDISSSDKNNILKECDIVLEWLNSNKSSTTEDVESKRQSLEKLCHSIFIRLHQGEEVFKKLVRS